MKGWLAYSGAFACALGAAALCYMAAFNALMTGSSYGIEGLILLAVILPVLAGLIVFGVTYTAFSGQSLEMASWAQGLAFVAFVTAAFFGLIFGGVLGKGYAMILMGLLLFFGGRMMIVRATHD